MLATLATVATLAAVAAGAAASPAPAPVALPATVPAVIPAPGHTEHYRITRTAQGNSGARTGVSDVTLRRTSATTLTLAGAFGDPPSKLTVLTVAPDGSLQIPAAAKAAGSDAALDDVVDGLNRLTQLFAGRSAAPHDGWSAAVRVPGVRGASATVVVPIVVENATATGFELHGVGQSTVQAQRNDGSAPPRGYGRPGAFRGPAPAPASSPSGPLSLTVAVDGLVRHGAVSRISIVDTRSISLDALPYVNVSGWTIEAPK